MNKIEVFCLMDEHGKFLEPAIQATTLAKYSRSSESAKEIVKSISLESAEKFQEKWVVEYGHNSVAELACIPVCFENVSIIASKFIESWQRPGFSEKSTRYQKFSIDNFVTPPGCSDTMKRFVKKFYDTYESLHSKMLKRCAKLMGYNSNDEKILLKNSVKARTFDNLRYLLPAGTGTNLAAVINMRDARNLITSMKGHQNSEFREIGDKTQHAIEKICPVLLRHTEPDNYSLDTKHLGDISTKFKITNPNWYVDFYESFCSKNENSEETQKRFMKSIKDVYGMDFDTFSKFMEARPEHKEIPDLFKTIRIAFDIMTDYGSFRDLQRHRRCEQFIEPLTINYGYIIPDDMSGTDIEESYVQAMESINSYGDDKILHSQYYQYMIPLGYLHRSVFVMDLKELYYIVELRTKPHGHQSYRKVAYEMYELAKNKYPLLMQWCRATHPSIVGEHL
jgi:thymidylate synthase ThyX